MAAIQIDNLTKRFGSSVAVESLSFDVPAGTVTGFVGPNGAGKTTTMRCLLGLARATSGRATIDGKPYAELPHPTRTVGAVLEGSSFYPGRSGRDHLRVLARAAGLTVTRVDEVLGLAGLTDFGGKRTKTYSLGMKQRLAVAAALLGDPEVLVLDEPANGLDPGGIRWLRDFLRYHASQGGTVLVSSHVLSEVALSVDQVVIVDEGKLVKVAGVDELVQGAAPSVRVRSPEAGRLAGLLEGRGALVETLADGALIVSLSAEEVGRLAAEHSIPVFELVQQTTSLEEAFFEATGRSPGLEQ